jgi:hypothetical protein
MKLCSAHVQGCAACLTRAATLRATNRAAAARARRDTASTASVSGLLRRHASGGSSRSGSSGGSSGGSGGGISSASGVGGGESRGAAELYETNFQYLLLRSRPNSTARGHRASTRCPLPRCSHPQQLPTAATPQPVSCANIAIDNRNPCNQADQLCANIAIDYSVERHSQRGRADAQSLEGGGDVGAARVARQNALHRRTARVGTRVSAQ